MPRKLAAGNWKMNGTADDLTQVAQLARDHAGASVDVLICPPATLITAMAAISGDIAVGAQDCHPYESGAHTGDLSAQMLTAAGATSIIVGHSERRTDHGETDAQIAAKATAAHAAGTIAIVCIGETLAERETGKTLNVIDTQLAGSMPASATPDNTVIAYEPVWAIGTGKVPTIDQIAQVHAHIRAKFPNTTLLYGGSVKGSNAADIFAVKDVDGALVGGASLKAADFSPIITALENA